MLCEKCNEREAMVTLTMVTNGVSKTHHFCHECANQFRLEEVTENSELSKTIFRILSQTIGKMEPGTVHEKADTEEAAFCPVCGKTLKDFREDGMFGCANCVRAFGKALNGTILSLQGTDTYTGSRPEKIKRRARVFKKTGEEDTEEMRYALQTELDSAILIEDYKKAAELRDRLRALSAEKAGEGTK